MRDGAAIAARLGGHHYAKGWMFHCPVHHDPVPSCSIRAADGLVTCFAGCPRREVEAALDALGFQDDGKRTNSVDARMAREQAVLLARKLWDRSDNRPSDRAHVEWYLRWRGITLPVPATLRRPTITINGFAARVQSPSGATTAVHTKSLGRKGISHGWMGHGAVRLAPLLADCVLGLAEGVETAMSATQLHGIPCWASLGARRLDAVTVPQAVREVHLFPDNDDAGRQAAARAVARYTNEGRRVLVHWPPEQDNDWNDTLRRGR